MKKKYVLVLDVEGTRKQLVYDISYMVIDKKGNQYEKHGVLVKEVWENSWHMNTAHYVSKVPRYIEDVETGIYKIDTLSNILRHISYIIKKYGITEIWAYNKTYDRSAIENTIGYITKDKPLGKSFFSRKGTVWENVEWRCIMEYCSQVLYTQKMYKTFCEENNLRTPKGYISTSAETGYKYHINDISFVEEHRGLYDIQIESELLARCIRQHKKFERHFKTQCWRYVNDFHGIVV